MKCPLDGSDLQMTERQGIEIDYCPKCRGVWLDRGELDKIIEKSSATELGMKGQPVMNQNYSQPYDKHNQGYGYSKHGKKKSMLGELFDF